MGLAWQHPWLAHSGDLEMGPATASPCGGLMAMGAGGHGVLGHEQGGGVPVARQGPWVP